MSDFSIRLWRPGDEAALKSVWRAGFDDPDEYIEHFYARFLKPGRCVLAEADGRPVSAIYLMDGPLLRPYRRKLLKSAYTYALSTLPEYRGRGIGAAVYAASGKAAMEQGADVFSVLPAEAGLYPFYEKAVPSRTLSAVRESRYTREELRAVRAEPCARIDALEYNGIRESLLSGEPHGSLSDDHLWWEEYQQELFGGGLFVLAGGAATVELDGDVGVVKELLLPDGDERAAVAGLAAFCPAREYIVRSPAFFDGPGEVRRFVIGALREEPDWPFPNDLWWGYAFE